MSLTFFSQRFNPGRKAFRVGMFVLKAALFLPLPLFCQTRTVAKANIPFAFSAGKQVMPAGTYTFSRVNGNVYTLRQTDGPAIQQMVVYDAQSREVAQDGKLTFRNYRSEYFLASFWFSGSRSGFQIRKSKAEKELLAAAQPAITPDVVVAINTGSTQP